MQRRDFIKGAGATIAGTGIAITSAPAIASGKIQWKLPTSFPAKAPGVGTNVTSFAKRVFDMSGGRLELKVFSSGELVPPFAVQDAVQKGTAEIGHSTAYYGAGKNSALHFFSTIPFGMTATEHVAWLRHGGGQELWDDIYGQRGLKPFYSGNSGTQSAGWFKKEINSVPPPEIFPAFKSGAIDAAEWVGPMLDQAFGLNKITNLCYVPAFHEPGAALEIVVNKDAFAELPKDLQVIVEEAARATSVETLAQFDYFNMQAFVKLQEKGVTFKEFPEDVVTALKGATVEVMADLAKDSAEFAKVQQSYDSFLATASQYANLFQGAVYRQRS